MRLELDKTHVARPSMSVEYVQAFAAFTHVSQDGCSPACSDLDASPRHRRGAPEHLAFLRRHGSHARDTYTPFLRPGRTGAILAKGQASCSLVGRQSMHHSASGLFVQILIQSV